MDYLKSACGVRAPRQGELGVVAVTTSASAAQDTGVTSGGPRWVTFKADVNCYITFGVDGTTTITDPDGTAVSGNGRTWELTAGIPEPFLISSKVDRYFKVRGTGAGYVRWYGSQL